MQYLAILAARRGLRPLMASPAHLLWHDGGVALRSATGPALPAAGVVRFYPGEWLPSLPSAQWRPFFGHSTVPLSNPATALLLQSKRFPLVWDELRTDLSAWRAMMPETRSPESVRTRERDDWVLKPVFGRVGEDVGIHGVTGEREMRWIARAARFLPRQWAAQRRFRIVPVTAEHGTYYPCVGVFTVDGKAAGAYGRVGRKPLIDHDAQDVAVLLRTNGASA
jgi:glutathionylspermidine synthase